MKNVKKIVQDYYSQRFREYDKQKIRTWMSERGFDAEIINGVIDALSGLENKLVLEVGVGSGRIGIPLQEEIKLWFVGLDLSCEMLKLAKAKMSSYRQNFDLVLGDADHLPFVNSVFDAVVCISTMHYFPDYDRSLNDFSRVLKEKGIFVYGDVAVHEMDNQYFLDALEKTLSKAHSRYYKPSEMKSLLESHGFCMSKARVISYRKSYPALMDDKGKYFGVKPEIFEKSIQAATASERDLYSMDSNELTLFYALIVALKKNPFSNG